MDTTLIKSNFIALDLTSQKGLLDELTLIVDNSEFNLLTIRQEHLNNKQGYCPHCESKKYSKDGHEKSDVQRYRCKICKRSFNAYTGTWLAKLNKKELLIPYLKLMKLGYSLDKLSEELGLNKKTVFDWRHKICAAIESVEESNFEGITESDETFFLFSEKGSQQLSREARKRGKGGKKKEKSKENVKKSATIVTMDRAQKIELKLVCLGRISKFDIENAIGKRMGGNTIFCTDGHHSFKGFALDNKLEHHILKGNIKQFTKNKIYHIQNVNSAHSRLKTWIEEILRGVSTKFLQNYLNWFRYKEKFKGLQIIYKIIESALIPRGLVKYNSIEANYENLLKSQSI